MTFIGVLNRCGEILHGMLLRAGITQVMLTHFNFSSSTFFSSLPFYRIPISYLFFCVSEVAFNIVYSYSVASNYLCN